MAMVELQEGGELMAKMVWITQNINKGNRFYLASQNSSQGPTQKVHEQN